MQRVVKADRSLYRLYLKLKKYIKRQQWADFWDALNELASKADVYIVGVPVEIVALNYNRRSESVEELEVEIIAKGVKTRIWMENQRYKKEIVVDVKQYIDFSC